MGLAVLAGAACVDRDVMGVNDEVAVLEQSPQFHIARGAGHIKVMSQNMYFGAPLEPIIAAPEEEIPLRVREAWNTMVQTDFPARAKAMAGYMDLWDDGISAKGRGNTCCHVGDLSNLRPTHNQRMVIAREREASGPQALRYVVLRSRRCVLVDRVSEDGDGGGRVERRERREPREAKAGWCLLKRAWYAASRQRCICRGVAYRGARKEIPARVA